MRHLARILSRHVRSVTVRNVALLTRETGLSPWDYTKWRMQEKFKRAVVPANDGWRSGLLLKLLEERRSLLEHPKIDNRIESHCTT